jgi:thiol-disulfide isomerase/thioredoxin
MTDARTQHSPSRHAWPRHLVGLLLLVAALVIFQRSRTGIRLAPADSAPQVAELALRDAHGQPVLLSERRGEVVLINLWASWCGPCRREVPRLSRLHHRLQAQGLNVWAINADSLEGAELQRVAAELGIDYPLLTGVGQLAAALQGGEVLPFTWLIDRAGRLRATHGGLASETSLGRACRKLLEEPYEPLNTEVSVGTGGLATTSSRRSVLMASRTAE